MTLTIEQHNEQVELARRVKFEKGKGHSPFEHLEPKPGSLHPFKRAAKLYTTIMELRASAPPNKMLELQEALAALPLYVSRGHGWKGRIKNQTILGCWNQDRSKPYPHPGRSEAARRVYQRLTPYQRKLAREIAAEELNRDELERGL